MIFRHFCLFPLHLFGLVSFYLVPSFVQYFSVLSIFSLFVVSFSQAVVLYSFFFLVSALSGWDCSRDLCKLRVGRDLCLCSWWAEVRFFFFPPMDSAVSVGMFWGVCGKPVCWWLGFCLCLACCLVEEFCSWVMPGLGYRWRPSWEFSLINTPWGQEFSGILGSWTQLSHSKGSGPVSGQGTKIPQSICHGIKHTKTSKHTKATRNKRWIPDKS